MSKSVKVRIAVYVTEGGRWNAAGWMGQDDDEAARFAHDELGSIEGSSHTVWVEADVPLPEARTVKGRVTP